MSLEAVIEAQKDPMLMISRRAFPEAQRLWEGPSLRRAAVGASLGWHDGDFHPETGAVALVQRGGAYEELVGDVLRLTRRMGTGDRTALVYVVETADREVDLSIARRTFMALGHLADEQLVVDLDVVEVPV